MSEGFSPTGTLLLPLHPILSQLLHCFGFTKRPLDTETSTEQSALCPLIHFVSQFFRAHIASHNMRPLGPDPSNSPFFGTSHGSRGVTSSSLPYGSVLTWSPFPTSEGP